MTDRERAQAVIATEIYLFISSLDGHEISFAWHWMEEANTVAFNLLEDLERRGFEIVRKG